MITSQIWGEHAVDILTDSPIDEEPRMIIRG